MAVLACPTCGSSLLSDLGPPPPACPDCCASLNGAGLNGSNGHGPSRRPRPVLRMPLGSDCQAPSAARDALGGLRSDIGEERYPICELLVSELVTNVVRHSGGPHSLAAADMRVRMYGDRVRVEVRDDGPGFSPWPHAPTPKAESGWGLQLVDELADAWGVERGVQNCVWFELGRTPLASGQHAAAHH